MNVSETKEERVAATVNLILGGFHHLCEPILLDPNESDINAVFSGIFSGAIERMFEDKTQISVVLVTDCIFSTMLELIARNNLHESALRILMQELAERIDKANDAAREAVNASAS